MSFEAFDTVTVSIKEGQIQLYCSLCERTFWGFTSESISLRRIATVSNTHNVQANTLHEKKKTKK